MNPTHTTCVRRTRFSSFARSALLALCAPLAAQQLSLPLAADNGGPPGGTVYFDLDVSSTVTFTQFDVNTLSLPGTPGSINVWVGPHTWVGASNDPTAWTIAGTGPVTAVDVDSPSSCLLVQPFALGPGTYALAIEYVGLQPAYSNGDGTNQTFANSELAFRAGAATPAAFAGQVASPRVFNGAIWYTPGGTPLPIASSIPFGTGCYAVQGTFSELFPAVAGQVTFDLDNSTLHLVPNGMGGYDVTRTAGAPIVPPGVQALGLGDDTLSIEYAPFPFPYPGGTANDIWVSSNGFIAFEPTADADFSPTEAELLAQGARLCPAWMDFNPGAPGSGNVHYEVDPTYTFVTITWNNVWQYGTTSPSRFQVVLRQTGEIEIRYGTVRNTDAPCIVGFSPGNGNFGQDGTDVDFSTITTLRSGFSRPLTLAVPQRPVLGATMSLTTSAIPANAMFTSNLLSLTQYDPAIDLATYGAPGCNQYCGTEAADLVLGTGTQTRALGPVPLDPVWIGLEIFSQSASLVPGVNALQILTSNGVKLRIGGL